MTTTTKWNTPRLACALSTTPDKEHLAPSSNKPSAAPVPHLKVIQSTSGDYTSSLVATRRFQPGQVIGSFSDTLSLAPIKRYSTVQVSKHAHTELNSDLVYMNHSCDPAAVVDVEFNCLKVVQGAKGMHKTQLDHFAVSKHILELAAERDSAIPKQAAEVIGLKA
ncbi:hypothetical protein BJ741DRAFT_635068 [Chytriomyces cf. hyalinus JEL632]|nr:hypothetical protein BJ741DRAFT_635068 [Chytriomyces cf. hyalinus JEL632]